MATDTAALDGFIRDVAALQARCRDDRPGLVEAVRLRLAQLMDDPDVLPEAARLGSPDRYTQHVLHVAPDRSHSIVALVWYPGQQTAIHDHVSWCVVGVYEGEETQTLYHLADEGGEVCLVETGREVAKRGSCTALIPPAENIHRVENAGSGQAISIHVYGADIERLGSSINKTFDDLPIRLIGEHVDAMPRAWRTVG